MYTMDIPGCNLQGDQWPQFLRIEHNTVSSSEYLTQYPYMYIRETGLCEQIPCNIIFASDNPKINENEYSTQYVYKVKIVTEQAKFPGKLYHNVRK